MKSADEPYHKQTVLDLFLKHEQERPNDIFLRQPTGLCWKNYSWRDVGMIARHALAAMQQAGLKKGDRVALLSQNCAAWIICDIAIMMGGYVSVPLYANVNPTTLNDILIHSESKLLFIGKLLHKDWNNVCNSIPDSVMKVTMNDYEKPNIKNWDQFVNVKEEPIVAKSTPSGIFTLIYTSGTTGAPKGVVHTHQSILNALRTAADIVHLNKKGNRFISYLPLSHAAERGLVECGALYSGGCISFVESQESFVSNIRDVRPTHFFGVPRIWEKFQSKILEVIPQKKLSTFLMIPLVSSLLKTKIKRSLGLNKALIILTGAAPVSPDLMKWFQKIDIPIQEAYGMSENFNVCSMNPKNGVRIGSVGKIFANQEVKIIAETHEIIQKCDWLMQGYYKEPELTAQTIRSGFLYTGDMGELSSDGYLTLTGRVKDIFKTSKGEYIAPGKIEMLFLSLPAVDQACVMGLHYPNPFILVVLSQVGKSMTKEAVAKLLSQTLNSYNETSMEYQKLQKVIVVKEEWTTDNGLLTPTLKMKRNAMADKYEVAMEQVYNTEEKVSWE